MQLTLCPKLLASGILFLATEPNLSHGGHNILWRFFSIKHDTVSRSGSSWLRVPYNTTNCHSDTAFTAHFIRQYGELQQFTHAPYCQQASLISVSVSHTRDSSSLTKWRPGFTMCLTQNTLSNYVSAWGSSQLHSLDGTVDKK